VGHRAKVIALPQDAARQRPGFGDYGRPLFIGQLGPLHGGDNHGRRIAQQQAYQTRRAQTTTQFNHGRQPLGQSDLGPDLQQCPPNLLEIRAVDPAATTNVELRQQINALPPQDGPRNLAVRSCSQHSCHQIIKTHGPTCMFSHW